MSENGVVDVTILGAGPTGLAAAYYVGHRDGTVRIVESLEQIGGQVVAVAPQEPARPERVAASDVEHVPADDRDHTSSQVVRIAQAAQGLFGQLSGDRRMPARRDTRLAVVVEPSVAAPPACSIRKATGLAS